MRIRPISHLIRLFYVFLELVKSDLFCVFIEDLNDYLLPFENSILKGL